MIKPFTRNWFCNIVTALKHLLLRQAYYENTEGLWIWMGLNLLFLADQTIAKVTGEMGKGERSYPEV